MHPYPHTYIASAAGEPAGPVSVSSAQVESLDSAPPPEFDGPGGVWSPETLMCASMADCFILTFRAVARAARFDWIGLSCRVEGVLERVNQVAQFTRFTTFAQLQISPGVDEDRARELLERSERGCLVANSLKGSRRLESQISVAAEA